MDVKLNQSDIDTLLEIAGGGSHVKADDAARLIMLGLLVAERPGWESTLPFTYVDMPDKTIQLHMTLSAMHMVSETVRKKDQS